MRHVVPLHCRRGRSNVGKRQGRRAARRKFHEETLPDLIAKLGDDDPEIRASAAAAVARHGSRAEAAVPALARALDDPDQKVQRAASAALGVIE